MSLLRRYLFGVLLVTGLTFAYVTTMPPLVQAADHECQYQLPLDPYLDQQAREEFKDDWYWDKTCVHQKEEAERNRTIMFVGEELPWFSWWASALTSEAQVQSNHARRRKPTGPPNQAPLPKRQTHA